MQDLIEREQREMRKNWRERSKNYIEEKKISNNAIHLNNFLDSSTPPDSPQAVARPL